MSTPYKNGHLQPPQYERAQLDAIATACSASKIAHVVRAAGAHIDRF